MLKNGWLFFLLLKMISGRRGLKMLKFTGIIGIHSS
jgi:hypothetical protein